MKKHLIIGNPIKHSLSPKLHNYWFKKNNIDATYEKILVKNDDELSVIFQKFKDNEIFAMNVTVPFKQTVIPFIDELSPIAKKTKSVNTIFKKDKKLHGDNTDVVGFELALKDLNFNYKNKSALILGAGGVVPSLIVGLSNLGIKKIQVSNRTQENFEKIKTQFPFIEQVTWGKLVNNDIIINATSVGLEKNDNLNLDLKSISSGKLFYDVIYNPSKTKFLEMAEYSGHMILNGKTMFIYQAQKAFKIWHNFEPKVDNDLINFLKND